MSSRVYGNDARPVFVMGSPRSGTTLLYHMLLSAGDFAVYHAEAHVFNMLSPRFGGLKRRSDREEMLRLWFRSEYFRRSGLQEGDLRDQERKESHNAPEEDIRETHFKVVQEGGRYVARVNEVRMK